VAEILSLSANLGGKYFDSLNIRFINNRNGRIIRMKRIKEKDTKK
jgi:hypothetical protein